MKRLISLFVAAATLTGCSVITPSQPTQFYVLNTAEASLASGHNIVVPDSFQLGVGPIQIPGYVDRPQIVTLGKGNRLNVADLDHWAEPVQDNVERILVSNISKLISSHQVFSYPATFQPNLESLQVSVEISEMIQTETGLARLVASWNVKRTRDNSLVKRQAESFEKQTVQGDYGSYSEGMSDLFGQLSLKIVQSLLEAGS